MRPEGCEFDMPAIFGILKFGGTPGVNFINVLRTFFVQIFGTKPNKTRENDVRTKNSYVKRR
jgi:hypothetical protein